MKEKAIAAVLATLAFGALGLVCPADGAEVAKNGIAAVVNGRVITKSQVAILVAPEMARLAKRFPNGGAEFVELLEASQKEALQGLVDQWKLIDQPNQPKIRFPANAVDQETKRVIRDDYEGDEKKLLDALRGNRMTMDGFREMMRDRLVAREIRLRAAGKRP